jgi:SAM-dependent methyltransferase
MPTTVTVALVAANAAEQQRWNDSRWAQLWPKRERLTNAVTPVLLEALALRPGDRVLDIGSGAGAAALRAAEIVGSDGAVIGADISAPLVELAEGRARGAGVGNASFQVADMQTVRVNGSPFTVAMSQFGVMFFDEPTVAFANIRAHLVAGGRFGFACWRSAERNPWFFASALAGLVAPPPPPGPGKSPTGPFALADADRVRDLLEEAGFTDVTVSAHQTIIEAPEDAVVDDAQLVLMGITAESMTRAHAAVDRHLAQFRQPSGMSRFPLAYQVVTARNAGD